MLFNLTFFLLGAGLAALTLRDVFHTVVVPGESRGILRVARRLLFISLPVWKLARRRGRGVSTGFAPFVLVGSFAIWMLLLCVSVGTMLFALRDSFHPPLTGFGQSIFTAGASIVTLGSSARYRSF